jgi:hypothetical protein
MKKGIPLLLLLARAVSGLFALEGEGGSVLPFALKIGGEITAEALIYPRDFGDTENAVPFSALDMVSGKLNLTAGGENAELVAGFNLSAASLGELLNKSADLGNPAYTPLILDEVYVRGYLGRLSVEAGLRKLTWGRADSLGPLDVINPLDYSDLTGITDLKAMKIARPMVHVSWNAGDFSKLEAVFIPNFTGHRFTQDGRWTPAQFAQYPGRAEQGIFARAGEINPAISSPPFSALLPKVRDTLLNHFGNFSFSGIDTAGIEYFQTGLRYTTTIGSADLGAQYFYGNLFRPVITIAGVDGFIGDLITNNMPPASPPYSGDPALLSPHIEYSRYHQIGVDYAQVLFDFNVRAEFAAHITKDIDGGNGAVKNPFLAWSLGFDRDIIWGINANIQCGESIRLLNGRVGANPVFDSEADTAVTATRLTMQISRAFLNDELECKLTGIWDIEDKDCYIIPSAAWTISDFRAELSAGVFAGDESGELGHYWRNTFVKMGVSYSF